MTQNEQTCQGLKNALSDFYDRGYAKGIYDYKQRMREEKRERHDRLVYLMKQKLTGVLLIFATILSIVILEDATIGVLFIPMGLGLIFSNDMYLVNNYYFEHCEDDYYE